jgi:hypothetical protein
MVFFDFAAAAAFLTLRLAALFCFALDMVASLSKTCRRAFHRKLATATREGRTALSDFVDDDVAFAVDKSLGRCAAKSWFTHDLQQREDRATSPTIPDKASETARKAVSIPMEVRRNGSRQICLLPNSLRSKRTKSRWLALVKSPPVAYQRWPDSSGRTL